MKKTTLFLTWGIRIIISLLFIVSAVAKMYPSPYFAISTFEVKQLYTLGFSENIAPWFSRILIGIEMALGILILQNNYLKKLIIPATILLLSVFVTHLSYVTFSKGGDSGNCGCFGELIPMTPIEAIIKNIVSIILLFILYKLLDRDKFYSKFWIVAFITLATIASIFLLAPIKKITSNYEVVPTNTTVIDSAVIEPSIPEDKDSILSTVKADSIKKTDIKKDSIKKEDLKKEESKTNEVALDEPVKHKSGYAPFFASIDKGKKTLCFFVPGCDHCRTAAKELTELKQKNPNFPPIYILFMNEEANLIPDFFKEATAQYPYKIIEIIPFWNLLGQGKDTPGVKYLWNGNEIKYYYGITDNKFNPDDYQKIITKTYSELKK
jgi:thiol-disulfide isomerase/thioredoxin